MQTRVGSTISEALHLIDAWIDPALVKGAGAAVWHGGEIVAERYAGEARPGIEVDSRTIFPLASVTKPVTASGLMVLVERGQVSLDEPVSRFVPEFVAASLYREGDRLEAARRGVTVRQLLSHTAGLPEDLPAGRLHYEERNDAKTISDALIELPLFAEPGTQLRYSNAGYAVLGRLVERLTDMSFADAINALVLRPLGLENTLVRPGEFLDDRIAIMDDAGPDDLELQFYNSSYWRSLGFPWAGMFGAPADLARFAGSFLPNGPRLLSRGTIREMTSDQVRGLPGEIQNMRVKWDPAVWGLGWEVKGDKRNHWTGDFTSPRTFCHIGASGTMLWADPDYDVALAVFANRTMSQVGAAIRMRWARLSNAVIAAL